MKYLFVFVALGFMTIKVQSQSLSKLFDKEKYEEVIQLLIEKEKYHTLVTSEYIILSKAYQKINKKYQSLLIANKIIGQLNGTENIRDLSIAYNLKAENLIDLFKIEEGNVFCDNALAFLKEKKTPFLQELCIKCGILYDQGGHHQKAYDTYALINNKKLKSLAIYATNFGVISMNLKKYQMALQYLKEGIEISHKTNQLSNINVSYTNIAKVLIAQKKWNKAKDYLELGAESLQSSALVNHKKEWLMTYYQFFRAQNKLNDSKAVLSQIQTYNDLIYDVKIQEKTKELSVINERKNILNKRVFKIDQEIKNTERTKLIWFVILISAVIIILARSLHLLYKNKVLKYNGILNEQELLSSQMTPHFIFNSLSILQGMVLNNEQEKATSYLSKFSNIVRSIVGKQSQQFVPINEELSGLKDYIDLQNLSTLKEVKYFINIEEEVLDQMTIPPMLLQPFIENAIIHGFQDDVLTPTISIDITTKEKILECIITDNGIGYLARNVKKSKNKKSLAINIVQDRLTFLSKQMKRLFSLKIRDLKEDGNRGTEVILKLPYQHV